ncbi:hypothetical protein [Polynucleobacter sp. JS-Fieb-80-E5]|uniref:hypothetical protein n=1 Tax=Polynucleobacter sp. JS-Fieb-80-E5 TaxID=2081050 RepID=UPI001C0CED1F|nr:hypothetical protein [Polynucleobacter sp. JS-Fieb-80-E5]MBU3617853.1 hypothetical protein [Polynucleobacter sp. JS-Fieb-80-E5]
MKLTYATPFARFLDNVASLPTISPAIRLDLLEEQLLNYILLASFRGGALLVGDIISLKQFGSQATLHGRIKNLVRKGYIRLLDDGLDRRRKLVHLTTKAENYYEQLSKCLTLVLEH